MALVCSKFGQSKVNFDSLYANCISYQAATFKYGTDFKEKNDYLVLSVVYSMAHLII